MDLGIIKLPGFLKRLSISWVITLGRSALNGYKTLARIGLGATLVVLVSGCVTTVRLAEMDLPKDQAEIRIFVEQTEIEPRESRRLPYAFPAFGIYGLLVANEINMANDAQAELLISDLRERLEGIDFGGMYLSRIKQAGVLDELSNEPQVSVSQEDPDYSEWVSGESWFELIPRVQFSNDMRTLLVSLELAYLTTPLNTGSWRPKRHFHHLYLFAWPAIDGDVDRIDAYEAAAAWQARSDEELLNLIEEGIETTYRMLTASLEGPRPAAGSARFASRPRSLLPTSRIWQVDGDIMWLLGRPNPRQFPSLVSRNVDTRHFGFFAVPENAMRRLH